MPPSRIPETTVSYMTRSFGTAFMPSSESTRVFDIFPVIGQNLREFLGMTPQAILHSQGNPARESPA